MFEDVGGEFNRYLQNHVSTADAENAWDWVCFCPMLAFSHVNGHLALDWVGRHESLRSDLVELAAKLKVTPRAVQHLNNQAVGLQIERKEGQYLWFYDANSIALVNDLYSSDFEAFGYEKVLPDIARAI